MKLSSEWAELAYKFRFRFHDPELARECLMMMFVNKRLEVDDAIAQRRNT